MNTPAGQDRLYASLNPLVLDGTLTPQQAERVYRAINDEPTASPTPETHAGWDRPRLFAALTVLATGLMATAYIVAVVVDGSDHSGWKSTLLLLATAAVVAAVAAAWLLLLQHSTWSAWVSGTLGAVALAGLTLAIVVLGGDKDVLVYLTGVLMIAGGAAGFWFLKGQLYTVVAVLGGLIVLGQIFSNSLDESSDQGDALTVGIAFLFYGVAVAAIGWFFSCRRLVGVIGLFIGGFSMLVVMLVNAAALLFAVTVSDPTLAGSSRHPDSVQSDIRVALLFGLIVVVLAALAHAYDGFVGFAVLAFLGALVLPASAIYSWHSEHPIRWGIGFAFVAAVGLAAIVGLQLDRRTPTPHQGYAGQPMDPSQGRDPHTDTIAR